METRDDRVREICCSEKHRCDRLGGMIVFFATGQKYSDRPRLGTPTRTKTSELNLFHRTASTVCKRQPQMSHTPHTDVAPTHPTRAMSRSRQKFMLVLGRHTHAAPCAAIASTSGGASRTVAERRCVQSAAHVQRHTWCIHAQSSGSVKWLNVHVHILSCLLPLKLGNEIRSQLYDCGFGGHHR